MVSSLALVLAVACGGGEARRTEQVASSSVPLKSQASGTTVSVDVTFPAGYGLSGVTVSAAGSLEIDDNVRILNVQGQAGVATNSGQGIALIKNGVKAATIASVGDIQVGNHVTASSLVSGGNVTLGKGDSVGTVTSHATLTPLVHRTLTYNSTAQPSDVTLAPNAQTSIAPGVYGHVVAAPSSTLTLSAGTYLLGSLDLEPNATLQLDTTAGTIRMYVQDSVTWKGATSGDPGRFVFAYIGTGTVQLLSSLGGTVLVPAGTLELDSGNYRGTFYAKDVIVKPGVVVTEVPPPLLIDGISVSPTTLCVGQAAEVTLQTTNSPTATPWIQGVVGAHQFVQFSGVPGGRLVFATVLTSDGLGDFVSVPVTVQQCPPPAIPPVALHFWGARGKPDLVDLSVSTYDASGLVVPMTGPATYVWTFGDGQTSTTTVPIVEHDYSAAVNHLAPYSFFNGSVAVTSSAGTASAQKVVSIWSLYAANRAKGIVQPPNTFSLTPASFVLTVTNYEPTPLSITQANVELMPCDPALDAQPQAPQPLSVVVPAQATANVTITPPAVTPNVCTIGMHLQGTTAAGAVRSDSYVRVGTGNVLLRQLVTDPASIALLNQASTLTADPNRFGERELQALVNQGLLPSLPPPVSPGVVYQNTGDECNPEDAPPMGFVCEPTADWVIEPPEMLNAFKGEVLMDHGCGTIGKLLAAAHQLYSHNSIMTKNRVEIRHSTAAEDRITSDVDIELLAVPPAVRIHPDTLRFGFPGTQGTQNNPIGGPNATHTIDEMVHTYTVTDPEGRSWAMSGEFNPSQSNQCAGDITAVPPLVVRPDPGCPKVELQPVVDQVLSTPSHYRFFMYSHSDMPSACTIPWCLGETSTVCSLFVRDSVSAASTPNSPLPLWPNGPEGPSPSLDGMNTYSVDIRTAGAHAMFSISYDDVQNRASPYDTILEIVAAYEGVPVVALAALGLIDLVATDIGNQTVNCFATDGCDDTGHTWEENGVGPGVGVSPDDMALRWPNCFGRNAFSDNAGSGTYGYNEPAVYLANVFRHKYTLQPVAGSGSINVIVEDDNGQPINGVTAILDSEFEGTTGQTGPAGTVHIPSVPQGSHIVEAQLYTGPPLTPLQLSPSPADILAMQACPAFPDCKGNGCPPGWTTSQTSATVANTDPNGFPGVRYYYACYPPTSPPPGCALLTQSRTVTVLSGQATNVTLTLCVGAICSNGVRSQCAQSCAGDNTPNNGCDNNSQCINGTCVLFQRKVHISDPGIQGLVSGDCICQPPNAFADLEVDCDPAQYDNLTDWLCDAQHQDFCTSPIKGGVTDVPLLLNGNGDCNTLAFHIVCTMDPQSGGLIVGTDMRLLDGCGGGAEDEGNARQWTVRLLPATTTSPFSISCDGTPDPPGCAPVASAEGGKPCSCGGFGPQPCWTNPPPICSNECCDNEADIGTAIQYTSVSK